MNVTNIVLLHLLILASQAFYMYLSNKAQLKKLRYLYLIAIPIAAAYPVLLNYQDPLAYSLYEYAVVFCIFLAAAADSTMAAVFNREYLTDKTSRRLIYSYLLICMTAALAGSVGATVVIVTAFLLAGSFAVFCLVHKYPAAELIQSIPLALVSVLCSWAFLNYGL